VSETSTSRRWAELAVLWLLALGFGLTAAMGYIASANFRQTDPRTLRNAEQVLAPIADAQHRRTALRYVASELNRHLFIVYDRVHLVVFGLAFVLYLLSRPRSRLVLGGLGFFVLLSLLYTFYLTPTLVSMGREIDFVPRDPPPPEVARFYLIHETNVALELIKLALIAAVSLALARRVGPRAATGGWIQ